MASYSIFGYDNENVRGFPHYQHEDDYTDLQEAETQLDGIQGKLRLVTTAMPGATAFCFFCGSVMVPKDPDTNTGAPTCPTCNTEWIQVNVPGNCPACIATGSDHWVRFRSADKIRVEGGRAVFAKGGGYCQETHNIIWSWRVTDAGGPRLTMACIAEDGSVAVLDSLDAKVIHSRFERSLWP